MRALASLALITVVAASAASASARTPIRVGIGDQNIAMFDQSAFRRAQFEHVRFLVAWNVMDDAPQRLAANEAGGGKLSAKWATRAASRQCPLAERVLIGAGLGEDVRDANPTDYESVSYE